MDESPINGEGRTTRQSVQPSDQPKTNEAPKSLPPQSGDGNRTRRPILRLRTASPRVRR